MKPPPFAYHDPTTLDEAIALLASLPNARPLAGGQSMMAMLNMRLAQPDHLVDLNRVAGLDGVAVEADGTLAIGAMARQRDVERHPEVARRCPMMVEALAQVGHRQTRNRGTIGGSLCHLDPSAELLNIAALLDARLTVSSVRGTRTLSVSEFAAGYMTTALEPDELLTAITLSTMPKGTWFGFVEFARRHGDFSIVACSALLSLDARGLIETAALAISGLSHAPVRPANIERALVGQRPDEQAFKAAAAEAQKLAASGDTYSTAAYRQHLARVLTFRVLQQAAGQARD